ncbi:unnamed protein product [Schistosoma margrebowiei]|uniref:Uncharacterized protein n=1 Tax=Schistosoma margrebowiei TaxID=48269 RepID=A0A3P7XP41_9TREM|nr:unnamed protein product [Schistosoma margrebowiei]
MEQPFLKVLPCQTGQLKSGRTKSNKPKVRRRSRTADCTEVYLDVVVGLAYRDEATELYWLEQPFLKVPPCQKGRLKSGKTKSNKTKVRRRSRTADCTEV